MYSAMGIIDSHGERPRIVIGQRLSTMSTLLTCDSNMNLLLVVRSIYATPVSIFIIFSQHLIVRMPFIYNRVCIFQIVDLFRTPFTPKKRVHISNIQLKNNALFIQILHTRAPYTFNLKQKSLSFDITGLILGLCPTNKRRRYFVTSFISWAQA